MISKSVYFGSGNGESVMPLEIPPAFVADDDDFGNGTALARFDSKKDEYNMFLQFVDPFVKKNYIMKCKSKASCTASKWIELS